MFYARRRRLAELAVQEAAGASFWSPRLDDKARWRIRHAVQSLLDGTGEFGSTSVLSFVRQHVIAEEGVPNLAGSERPEEDVLNCILRGEEELVFSVLEALLLTVSVFTRTPLQGVAPEDRRAFKDRLPVFEDTLRTILREHRVSFDLVEGRLVPLASRELHQEVVRPLLTLLGGRQGLEAVEKAYRDALDEIATGKPEDAITDAGTALQEALAHLGCSGNSLGAQLKDARKLGLLAPHDSRLTSAIEQVIDWVSADRSEKGDAHAASPAAPEDAWLSVHIVGALILRLVQEPNRSSPRDAH